MSIRLVRRGMPAVLPAGLLALGVLVAGCSATERAVAPTPTSPRYDAAPVVTADLSSGGGVVISQVYGGGGNTGAPFNKDFVELYNAGPAAVSIAGWSVQYASATGTGTFAPSGAVLAGTLQPGQYYLVHLGGGSVGANLPTADATGTTLVAAGGGKVALVDQTAALPCNGSSTPCTTAQRARIIDLVGFGTANYFEGTGATPAPSNTLAAIRKANGCTDTNDNAADFTASAPTPRNTGSPVGTCGGGETPPAVVTTIVVTPTSATIAQGTTQQFTASARDAQNNPIPGAPIVWSIANGSAVATVNATGLVTGQQVGQAQVVATSGSVTGSATVTVTAAAPQTGNVRVTEFHYDNANTDVGEAVEVEGDAGTSLAGWSLVLYSGSTGSATQGQSYGSVPLSGVFASACGGTRGVLSFPTPNLQNGDKDGFAVVDASGQVVEFLSYEGSFTAVDGPAAGRTSVDVGVSELSDTPAGQSLQRAGNGVWFGPATATFGACNPATPPAPEPTPTGLVLEGYSFRGADPIPVGFGELYRVKDTGTNLFVRTGLTWASSNEAIATVDGLGNVTARGVGSATITATQTVGGRTASTTVTTTLFSYSDLSVYADELQFGTPTDATPDDEFLINRATFANSWNATRGQPNWVAYNLEATHRDPVIPGRCDCFIMDPAVPSSFPLITTADYDGSNYSRGHMTMSQDRIRGTLDNAETFYFSNIIPQTSQNNAGPWLALENYLGDLARNQNKEIFIVAGGAAYSGSLNNANRVAIPTRTWKVAVILDRNRGVADVASPADVEIIAVDMPNTTTVSGGWEQFRVSVDQVEQLTGYDLLSALPDGIEQIVEARRAGVRQVFMDLQPGQISVSATSVVNVTLFSEATFDAAAVNAADLRLVTSSGTAVAPLMRGTAVNTSVRDMNGDGRLDRVISFSTSALRTAGFSPTARELVLRPIGATPTFEAFDVTPPTVVP